MTSRKVAVVTGGGGGIGAAVARRLSAAADVAIAVVDVDGGAADRVAASLACASKTLGLEADVTSPGAMAEVMSVAGQELRGDITYLVAAAGIAGPPVELLETTPDVWRRLLDVNLLGTVTACLVARPMMRRAGWGRIVTFGSIAGVAHRPGRGAYGATKAAVLAFTRSLATELASENITVNAVCPGATRTPMLTEGRSVQDLDRLRRNIPTGRLVDPAEVAATVCFLLSDEARSMTGQALHVNGGEFL